MLQPLTQGVDLEVHSRECLHRRDGLACALLMACCILLAWPFVETGFIDDWSYIKMAQVFAETGRFVYNGWATAGLGWQVLWGSLFSRLFGFSFINVRLSILPIAMASVYLLHQILLRFGISRGNAIFGTLSLAFSPVFLPMSASYMTDVPGLFCTLLCLYLCQHAISAVTDRAALGWLSFATLTNLAGGTVRQTVWVGVLILVPSAVWLLRRRRVVLWGGTLLWLIGVASVFALMHWLNRQPYFLPEYFPVDRFTRARLKPTALHEIGLGWRALLCTLLLLFPILVAWLPIALSAPKRMLIRAGIILSLFASIWLLNPPIFHMLILSQLPWLPGVIELMTLRAVGIPGSAPNALADWQRVVVATLVLASALAFFAHLFGARWSRQQLTTSRALSWQQIFSLLTPYTVGYIGALMVRGIDDIYFDRYFLVLQALGIIFLLRYYQDFARPARPPMHSMLSVGDFSAASWVALLAFAFFAVAGTHDWFEVFRARLEAADQIRRAGVPRTAIQGGFEYDGWTQIEDGGYLNDPRIRLPANAFHDVPPSVVARPPCAVTWFYGFFTPKIIPRYFIVYSPLSCLDSTAYPAIPYRLWMPPFTGQIYVQIKKD